MSTEISDQTKQESGAEKNFFRASADDFKKIPGRPIAYWVSDKARLAFKINCLVGDSLVVRGGMTTGDNDQFLRLWFEVDQTNIGFGCSDSNSSVQSQKRWFPYQKGGSYRRWFGNRDFVVNWENDGTTVIENGRATPRSRKFYFKEALTYTATSSSYFGIRYTDAGFLFDAKGSFCVSNDNILKESLGYLSSSVSAYFLKALNPSIEFQAGDISRLPYLTPNNTSIIVTLVDRMIHVSRFDWDNFESSWDFKDLPLLRNELKVESFSATWQNWKNYCDSNIVRMKELEEENNRIWIDAYGLQDELTPEVPENEITLARSDKQKDMAAFISYAVGCMFGRYSLDKPGLILANAGETLEDYVRIVTSREGLGDTGSKEISGDRKEMSVKEELTLSEDDPNLSLFSNSSSLSSNTKITFLPDEDNIIPVLDGEWFTDDIVARFREFLKITFGEKNLQENIRFIEEALGKDLRKYFTTDFYKNHISNERAYGYKKRPIYWMFQSPKKSFQAMIYMHRYNRDTVNLLLNDYLREFQNKLQNHREHLKEIEISESSSAKDVTKAKKEQSKIEKMLTEMADWERDIILPLAQQRLEIDLDDGVKQNYPKFGKALAKIAGVS